MGDNFYDGGGGEGGDIYSTIERFMDVLNNRMKCI